MYQHEYHYNQPQQQQSTVMVQPTGLYQPVACAMCSAVCESYNRRQSMIVAIMLISAGVLSVVFNFVGMGLVSLFHGSWCGMMVSWNLLSVQIVLIQCNINAILMQYS